MLMWPRSPKRVGLSVLLGCWMMWASGARPTGAAEPPRFFQYSQQDLRAFETRLGPRMNQYKQAAEQLGDFGNQTAWVAHREADGLVEVHENWSDLVFVVSGSGSLRVGGELRQPYVESSGEVRATAAQGGTVHPVREGDVLNVPAGMPHQFLVPSGQQITFFTMKIAKVQDK
jgi:mannose-6-phosphate isomerase-like protein (cupin superfamily)